MATVPRGGSALARIAGNCLAAMAHTMGCGAVTAGGVPAIARNRPQPSNAVGRVRCRWHRHRRPLRPGIHDSLPWKKTPPRRPVRPPPRRRLAREARPQGRDGPSEFRPVGASSAGAPSHASLDCQESSLWSGKLPAPALPAEQFVPIRCAGAWMTGFQAQVVHRHASHTAPSRGKPLIWAMAARV